MKTTLLYTATLIIAFFATATMAFGNCAKSSAHFDLNYTGAVKNANNTYTLSVTVKNNNRYAFGYVVFELPAGAKVISPASSYNSKYSYIVEKTSNPFNGIKFEANSAESFKNGASDVFGFTLSAADYNRITSFRVYTKSSTTVGAVTYSTTGCATAPEIALAGANNNLTVYQNETATFTAQLAKNAEDVSYDWTVPSDWNIVEGEGTSAIKVHVGTEEGPVTVKASNPYGESTSTINVTPVNKPSNMFPLPVEIKSFDARTGKNGVTLNWATATELENDRFEIERSRDGKLFSAIGTVKGAGNSSTTLAYTYTDFNAVSGTTYYRLKQIDFDGTTSYSKVVMVESAVQNSKKVTLAPNPVTDGNFSVMVGSAKGAELQIIDMTGKLVSAYKVQEGSEIATVTTSELGMSAGTYFVVINSNGQVQREKLIVR